jgi:phage terminase large subunit-like protein
MVAEVAQLSIPELNSLIGRERWLNHLAKPYQRSPATLSYFCWLMLAGRGSGKTRAGAEDTWMYLEDNPGHIMALIGPTQSDTRHTMFEGESGLLACMPEGLIQNWNKGEMILTLTNGSMARGFSAEKPDRLRGPQFHRAWADEVCAWQHMMDTWDMLMFCLRLGENPQCLVTTTPRPVQLIRELAQSEDTLISRATTYDNAENLADTFLAKVRKKYEGTRLGEQELHGKILSDNPFALWKDGMIIRLGLGESIPALDRIAVAIDPPATSGEKADECGIVVVGRLAQRDANGYEQFIVLEDASCQGLSPLGWAARGITAADKWDADVIVAEVNNGGDMVISTIRTALQTHETKKNFSLKKVHATRGKVSRAEPISGLYEQGRVIHVGHMGKLEDQMLDFTTDFDASKKGYSPDRVDALVWGLHYMNETQTLVAGLTSL